jgi:outer membrane biosynthesis protein TonB
LGQYQNELIELLRGVVEHGTGRAAALPGFAAGKTGTAQDYRDAWFVGFNDSLVVGVWVGNDDHSAMQRVTGGTLPAAIWKKFMVQAIAAGPAAPAAQQKAAPAPDVSAQQKTNQPPPPVAEQQNRNQPAPAVAEQPKTSQPVAAAAEQQKAHQTAPALAEQQARPPKELFNQNTAGGAHGQCNVAACQRAYRSFRAADCTYQPDEGGARRFCDRQGGNATAARPSQQRSANRQQTNGQDDAKDSRQETAQRTERAATSGGNAKCNASACQHFSSFRASDCTYQPFGGGPRRVCGSPDDRTASRPRHDRATRAAPDDDARHERAARSAPDYDERGSESFADAPDRDGPRGWPGFGRSSGPSLFDWGGQGQD